MQTLDKTNYNTTFGMVHHHGVVGLLLIQDVIAIFVILILLNGNLDEFDLLMLGKTIIALPLFAGFAVLFVKYVLLKLIQKFDRFHEYIFLLAIGWCLGMAELAALFI